MKNYIFIACAIGTLAFVVSVYLGLLVVFRTETIANFIISGVFAFIILALMLSTKDVFKGSTAQQWFLRAFWLLSFAAGTVAVYLAECRYIILGKSFADPLMMDWATVVQADLVQRISVIVALLFLVAAPIGFSYQWETVRSEHGIPDEEDVPRRPKTKQPADQRA